MTEEELYENSIKKCRQGQKDFDESGGINYGTGQKNARYGYLTSKYLDGTGIYTYNYNCHAYLKYLPSDSLSVWSSMIWPDKRYDARKESETYIKWITDPEKSPWWSLFKTEKRLNHQPFEGFVFLNLSETPSNLAMNFLIGTRMAHEWPQYLKEWWNLVYNEGFDPGFAFIFLDVFVKQLDNDNQWSETSLAYGGLFHPTKMWKEDRYRLNYQNKYDWPFDVVTSNEESVIRFCTGKPDTKKFNHPLIEIPDTKNSDGEGGGMYKPVNAIWGHNTYHAYEDHTYGYKLFQLYKDKFGRFEQQKGFSKQGPIKLWTLRYDEILVVMFLESTRLGLGVKRMKECG